MPTIDAPDNAILAMLPQAAVDRIHSGLSVVSVTAGDVLLNAGDAVLHVYFPIDAVFSFDQVTGDSGSLSEAPASGLCGNEGLVGFEPLFGSETSINRISVRISGRAVRFDANLLHDEFGRGGVFHRLVLRSTDALFAQVCAVSACERAHPVQQRLIRWLLSFDDRVPLGDLHLTQRTLSQVLGVRRVSVTEAAMDLQKAGLIAYQRGMVDILDRGGLLERACKCYREIRARYDSYLHGS